MDLSHYLAERARWGWCAMEITYSIGVSIGIFGIVYTAVAIGLDVHPHCLLIPAPRSENDVLC